MYHSCAAPQVLVGRTFSKGAFAVLDELLDNPSRAVVMYPGPCSQSVSVYRRRWGPRVRAAPAGLRAGATGGGCGGAGCQCPDESVVAATGEGPVDRQGLVDRDSAGVARGCARPGAGAGAGAGRGAGAGAGARASTDGACVASGCEPGHVSMVLIDGTWRQAQQLVRLNPHIFGDPAPDGDPTHAGCGEPPLIPRVHLSLATRGEYVWRREPHAFCLSTAECVAHALAEFTPDAQVRFHCCVGGCMLLPVMSLQ